MLTYCFVTVTKWGYRFADERKRGGVGRGKGKGDRNKGGGEKESGFRVSYFVCNDFICKSDILNAGFFFFF